MDTTILDDLKKAGYDPAPYRPEGFGITVREFMAANEGCTEGVARKMLSDATDAGVLEAHRMNCGAGACTLVYCRPKDWPPA